MHALTIHAKEDIRHEKVDDPQLLAPDDVIVQTELTAVCGSDLHVYHGRETGIDPGTVMGHEFIGTIVETGRNVTRFQTGDRVFSPFFSSCGSCFFCESDLSCRCENGHLFGWVEQGRGLQGVQAEWVRVPHANHTLHRIPSTISSIEALLLCDILPTGYFCADMAFLGEDKTYAVIGCGPVGLLAIAGLRARGAERIWAFDLLPYRLKMAEEFGAIPIDASRGDHRHLLQETTEGRGADAVLEVVGSTSAQKLAYELVRAGGTIAVVGVHTSDNFAFAPAALYDKNLTYKTGRCPVQRYIPELIPIVESGKFDFERIISHQMKLSDGPGAYELFAARADNCTKIVLKP